MRVPLKRFICSGDEESESSFVQLRMPGKYLDLSLQKICVGPRFRKDDWKTRTKYIVRPSINRGLPQIVIWDLSGLCYHHLVRMKKLPDMKVKGQEDCWRMLKDESKWNAMYQSEGVKRAKVPRSGAYTSSYNADISDHEVCEERPIGQKAAKRKG
uniref:No apical meristem-associated C-terminal domain-containing protein n=1 Tax=Cannabis sativa TaxID=3483 RepID=A0A803P5P0_CANSA